MAWVFIIIGGVFVVGAVIALMYYYEKSNTAPKARINKIQDENYDPNMTSAAARLKVEQSKARTEAAVQVGEEVRAVKDMISQQTEVKEASFKDEHTLERLEREEESNIETHKLEIDDINLQKLLISNAQRDGMDVTTYLEVLKTRALNAAEIEMITAKAKAELRAGFIFKLQEYQELSMVREVLDGLYEQHYLVETTETREPVKRRKLAQIDKDITLHEKDADGRRTRLLQSYNGQEVQGSDEDSDDSGNS